MGLNVNVQWIDLDYLSLNTPALFIVPCREHVKVSLDSVRCLKRIVVEG